MKAGEQVTIKKAGVTLVLKLEDTTKSDVISAKIEEVIGSSDTYRVGQVCEFSRDDFT